MRGCGTWGSRAVGLALVTMVAGCTGDAPNVAEFDLDVPDEARYGGTVVLAGTTDIPTFNPVATADELSGAIQREVLLMTLLRADRSLQPQPYLAESWAINEDSTQVVFHLRDDVRWHDGEPTTAADVEFTFNALKNPESAFPNAEALEGWEGAEVLDPQTIRFAVRPRAGLLTGWTRLPILPRHILGDTPATALATHAFGVEPVGNGPYRFARAEAGDTWVFEANDAFPDALGGRPYLERLVYRSIPEPATQLAELRTGGIHGVRLAAPGQLTQAASDPALVALDYPDRAYGFIAWNGQRPFFQDPAIRRALTIAMDRQALVDVVRGGLGEVANGPIGTWHPAHDTELEPLPFDPPAAADILEAAGWVDRNGDGIRERDGVRFSFSLLTSERDTYQQIAEIVQAQAKAVGVEIVIETVDSSSFIDRILSAERRFDAFVLEWVPDFVIDDRQLFACESVGEMFQFTSYCNHALEATLDSIPRSRSREENTRLLRTYARTIAEDQPFSFLYFSREAGIYRKELQGVGPDIRGDLTNVRSWWVHPDARATEVTAAVP